MPTFNGKFYKRDTQRGGGEDYLPFFPATVVVGTRYEGKKVDLPLLLDPSSPETVILDTDFLLVLQYMIGKRFTRINSVWLTIQELLSTGQLVDRSPFAPKNPLLSRGPYLIASAELAFRGSFDMDEHFPSGLFDMNREGFAGGHLAYVLTAADIVFHAGVEMNPFFPRGKFTRVYGGFSAYWSETQSVASEYSRLGQDVLRTAKSLEREFPDKLQLTI